MGSSEWADCVISATPRVPVNASSWLIVCLLCAFCAIFVFGSATHVTTHNSTAWRAAPGVAAAAAASGSTNWLILSVGDYPRPYSNMFASLCVGPGVGNCLASTFSCLIRLRAAKLRSLKIAHRTS